MSTRAVFAFILTFLIDLGGHALAMGAFGFAGYWAHQWDERAGAMLARKRAEIAERRDRKLAHAA